MSKIKAHSVEATEQRKSWEKLTSMGKPKIRISGDGHDYFIVVDGLKIAKRGTSRNQARRHLDFA